MKQEEEKMYNDLCRVTGEFQALLCPKTLSVRGGVIYAGDEPALQAVLGKKALWIKTVGKNPFWYPPGQRFVATSHLDMLIRFWYRAAYRGFSEALEGQRERWIGGGNWGTFAPPFAASYEEIDLVPAGYVQG